MYLLRQTTRSFLFIIPLWIVSVWEMASQVQQERFVSWNIRCTHRTQQRWRHCTTLCCVYSSTDFGYDYDDVDEDVKYTWSFYMTLIYFSFTLNAILCNCNVALWRKKFCISNPTVQTPTVNYGQFSSFGGKPFLSVQSPAFVSKAACSMLDSSS